MKARSRNEAAREETSERVGWTRSHHHAVRIRKRDGCPGIRTRDVGLLNSPVCAVRVGRRRLGGRYRQGSQRNCEQGGTRQCGRPLQKSRATALRGARRKSWHNKPPVTTT